MLGGSQRHQASVQDILEGKWHDANGQVRQHEIRCFRLLHRAAFFILPRQCFGCSGSSSCLAVQVMSDGRMKCTTIPWSGFFRCAPAGPRTVNALEIPLESAASFFHLPTKLLWMAIISLRWRVSTPNDDRVRKPQRETWTGTIEHWNFEWGQKGLSLFSGTFRHENV